MFVVIYFAGVLALACGQVGLPGGIAPVDVHRKDITDMAAFAVNALNAKSNGHNQLIEIVAAKTQVVAGINYYLTLKIGQGSNKQTCDVVIFDQSWTSTRELSSSSCKPTSNTGSCPGCVSGNVDVSSADVQEMASFAVQSMNLLKSGPDSSLVSVVSARKQVVAGTNYYLTLKITDGHYVEMCDVVVFDQPWTQTRQVMKHSCHNAHRRSVMAGGVEPAQVNDNVRNAADFAIDEINMMSNSMYRSVLVGVGKVTKQVVSGLMYRMDLTVGTSTCQNSVQTKGFSREQCPLNANGKTQHCHVTVWFRAWQDPKYQLTNFHCE